MKDDNKPVYITVKPYKCESCDKESCEYLLWCKGKNVEK